MSDDPGGGFGSGPEAARRLQHVVHRQVTALVTKNRPRRTKAREQRGGLPTHSIGTFS